MRRRLNARRRRTLDGPSLPGCRGCGARRRRFCGAAVGGYSPSTLGPIRLPGNEWACTTKLARRSWTFRRLTSAIGLHYKTVRWAWSVKILVTLPPLPTLHVPYEMFKFSVCKAPCVARWQVIALWMLQCPQLWILFLFFLFFCHPLMVSLAGRVSNCLVISNGASWLILRLFLPRFRLVFLALLPGHASGHCPLHFSGRRG